MIHLRNSASFALAGALVTLAVTGSGTASAGDEAARSAPSHRCAAYGAGFVDVGNGLCGRVSSHVRVDMGPSHAALNGWSAPQATSTAGMRTDGAGMVPGAGAMQHLRVRNGLDTYDPFH